MHTQKNPSSYEEIKKALGEKIKRVYILLEASAMPDDVKVSWKSLLPEMTQAQVDRLIALLDQELTETLSYMKKHGQPEKELLSAFAKIEEDEEKQQDTLHTNTLKQLDDLARKLSDIEMTAQKR